MFETVLTKVVAPIFARLGTMLGGLLAGFGLTASEVETVTLAILAIAGVVFDLVVRNYVERDKE